DMAILLSQNCNQPSKKACFRFRESIPKYLVIQQLDLTLTLHKRMTQFDMQTSAQLRAESFLLGEGNPRRIIDQPHSVPSIKNRHCRGTPARWCRKFRA